MAVLLPLGAPPPALPPMHPPQRIMSRQQPRLSDAQQQNQTRWAVFYAAKLLQQYDKEYAALQAAMAAGKPVAECIRAIEEAA